jgi:uncharacterized membrane protein YhaH (DUF805 family)
MNNTILEYVVAERARGVNDADIRSALLVSGWKEEDITTILGGGDLPAAPAVSGAPKVAPGLSGAYLKQLFAGRIGRWHYFFGSILLQLAGFAILLIIGLIAALVTGAGQFPTASTFEGVIGTILVGLFVVALFLLPILIVNISMMIRRLHDLGQSGWWSLVAFIPWVGWILSIYLIFFKGDRTRNAYGPVENNPRNINGAWASVLRK